MAEESDLERSEPASARRLEQARERGQVPRSAELSTFAVLLAAGGGLILLGPVLVESLERVMRAGLTLDRAAAFDAAQLTPRLYASAADVLLGLSPLLVVVAVVAIVSSTLLSGWLFTFQALQPDFARLNPRNGLGRIFSVHGAIEFGKALLKIILVLGVATWVVWAKRAEIASLIGEPLARGLAHLGSLLGFTFLVVAGAYALVAALDVLYQIWDHGRQLRMTRDEMRQELRETEGDPQMRARVRWLQQRDARRRRMMAEVPRADVVVTSPGRCAVALRYDRAAMRAPRVVAKGPLALAGHIVQLAHDGQVPVLRAPQLARALFAHAQAEREVPAALYDAVAEVFSWVYQLRRFQTAGGERPREPAALRIPPGWDPGPAQAN